MYTVNFYFKGQLIKSFDFGTELKAITCLMNHADAKGLTVSANSYYAADGGNIPEQEIEIVQYS